MGVELKITHPRVAEINRLVDQLISERGESMPYIHQSMGGVCAPVLSVLRDPGPATKQTRSLGLDNPDPTSRRQIALLELAGLSRTDLMPWNAYPWHHTDPLTSAMVARGAAVLPRVIGLMRPTLKVLLLQGDEANLAWAMLQAFVPEFAEPPFKVVHTCHPLGTRRRDPDAAAVSRKMQESQWLSIASAIS